MLDPPGELSRVARSIHAAPGCGVLYVTGGGAGMLAALLGEPGASATVLEAGIPYAEQALEELLGARPEQSCSPGTARDLAMRGFLRARQLGGGFGFAITASLATTVPKRGAHRAHVAFQDTDRTRTWSVEFAKDGAVRAREEAALADLALRALAASLGIGEAPPDGYQEAIGTAAQTALILGTQTHAGAPAPVILSGAFNPLHEGHRAMRADAERRLGQRVAFELCVANVDKPPLNHHDIASRLRQFDPDEVLLTSAPTFLAKARALGPVTFVVGTDTIARIAEPRYYEAGRAAARDAAVAELATIGCRFLVYGRTTPEGFTALQDVPLPPALRALCTGVREEDFRMDISSSELRAQGQHSPD